MTILIADVGGSNSRLALAKNAQDVPRQIGHFNNADFTSFDAVVEAYLARERPGKITACSIALAGPVTSDVGALTNRDWTISSTDLRLKLGCDAVCLLNDLTALGFAIDALPEAELKNISPGAAQNLASGQSLVVGLGTGFNVCPVLKSGSKTTSCFEVEAGHVTLSYPIVDGLRATGIAQPERFQTVEDLFSGTGMAAFHHARTGQRISAREVVENATHGDCGAGETVAHFTTLLGMLVADLALQYLPLGGIYFAGSVARGVLQGPSCERFLNALHGPRKMGAQVRKMPVKLILDDAAALRGCLRAVSEP